MLIMADCDLGQVLGVLPGERCVPEVEPSMPKTTAMAGTITLEKEQCCLWILVQRMSDGGLSN